MRSKHRQRGCFVLAGGLGFSKPSGGGDPYFANVVSLLPLDVVGTTFTDVIAGKTWTVTNETNINATQFKWGGASAEWDGASDLLTSNASADFNFNGTTATIEGWFRTATFAVDPNGGDRRILSFDSVSPTSGNRTEITLYQPVASPGKIGLYVQNAPSTAILNIISSSTFSTNTWYYYRINKTGTTGWVLYVAASGSLSAEASGTASADIDNVSMFVTYGGYPVLTSQANYQGFQDDLRITKGVSRTDANVPTGPFPTS